MFHIGHLNLLNRAKEQCDYLIVGVNADKLVKNYKNKFPIVSEDKRLEIISSVKIVDKVCLVHTLNKVELHSQLHFNTVFIGSDWKNNSRWQQTKIDLKELDVETVFLPYTKGISSTILRDMLYEKNY